MVFDQIPSAIYRRMLQGRTYSVKYYFVNGRLVPV